MSTLSKPLNVKTEETSSVLSFKIFSNFVMENPISKREIILENIFDVL